MNYSRNVSDRKRSALALLPMLLIVGSNMNTGVEAFQAMSPKSAAVKTSRGSRSHLEAAPLHELPLTVDPQELSAHAHALHGFLQHHTSTLLSDAAVATPDMASMEALDNFETAVENLEAVEAAIVEKEGWWAAYLNVFKTTLDFVHSKIDDPIHKLGWEGGTWGFSIALFTAGKSEKLNFSVSKQIR